MTDEVTINTIQCKFRTDWTLDRKVFMVAKKKNQIKLSTYQPLERYHTRLIIKMCTLKESHQRASVVHRCSLCSSLCPPWPCKRPDPSSFSLCTYS